MSPSLGQKQPFIEGALSRYAAFPGRRKTSAGVLLLRKGKIIQGAREAAFKAARRRLSF